MIIDLKNMDKHDKHNEFKSQNFKKEKTDLINSNSLTIY